MSFVMLKHQYCHYYCFYVLKEMQWSVYEVYHTLLKIFSLYLQYYILLHDLFNSSITFLLLMHQEHANKDVPLMPVAYLKEQLLIFNSDF